MRRSVQSAFFALAAVLAALGCDKLKPGGGDARGSQPVASISASSSSPPVPSPPASASASAGIDPNASELEQAKAYSKGGQLWLARLVLEQKALGEGGTREEASYLADLCQEQGDQACLDSCGKKLGKKLVLAKAGAKDAGAAALPSAEAEDNSDFGKARALMLKGQNAKARALLEPRVLENKASREEVRLLLEVCRVQKDKMCMALCQSRLGA